MNIKYYKFKVKDNFIPKNILMIDWHNELFKWNNEKEWHHVGSDINEVRLYVSERYHEITKKEAFVEML